MPLVLTLGRWGCLNLRLGQKNVNRKLSGKEVQIAFASANSAVLVRGSGLGF